MLKEELNSQNNPCVATGIFLTATYRNFPKFHSVICNPCQLLLICVLLSHSRVIANWVLFSKLSVFVQNLKYLARFCIYYLFAYLCVRVLDFVLFCKDALQF